MTFSLTENFEKEFYVDNEFYISNIKEMDRSHFEYPKIDESNKNVTIYLRDEYGNIINFTDFKKENSFYLYIPKEGSINYKK